MSSNDQTRREQLKAAARAGAETGMNPIGAMGKVPQLSYGVPHYDFNKVIFFWIGASVVSMLLAASLWRVRAKE